jgi:zinc/manganese transport system substrate-binding protein
MKRVLTFLAVATMLAGANIFAAERPLKVASTLTNAADLTKEIGGDRVEVQAIAKGYQDPHFVEPKPSFLMMLRDADLLEVVGLELEIGYLPPLIDQSRNPKILPGANGYLDLSRGVEILDRPTGAVNRSMGDVHPMGNPHYWLDPANAVRMAIEIEQKLAEMRPADEPYFAKRLNDFKIRINEANKRWLAEMAPFRGAKIVTYHNSWPNFAKHFGLDVVGFVEPKPGVPPSPSHTLELINLMKDQHVRVIAMEPYFDSKTPQFIADRVNGKVVVLYPSVGGAKSGTDDYIQLIDTDISLLTKALK